jgi:hypothetical protein
VTLALLLVALAGLGAMSAALVMTRATDAGVAAAVRRCAESRAHAVAARERALAAAKAVDEEIAQLVVEAGTSGVRDVHHAIADIPLDVLASLPATRAAAERVRAVHDPIADGVYDAISIVNKATGSVLRALRGDKRPDDPR